MARGKHRKRATANRARRANARREELTGELAVMTELRQKAERDQHRAEQLVREISDLRAELIRRQEPAIVALREEIRELSDALARHKAATVQTRHDNDRKSLAPLGADRLESLLVEAEVAFRGDHPDLVAAELEAEGWRGLPPEASATMTMDIGVVHADNLTVEQVRILQRKRGLRRPGPLQQWAGEGWDRANQ